MHRLVAELRNLVELLGDERNELGLPTQSEEGPERTR